MSKLSSAISSSSSLTIPLAGPLLVFVLGGLFGLFASYDPALSTRWLLWLVAGTMIYILVVVLVRSKGRLQFAAPLPVLLATLFALALATQYRYLDFNLKFGTVARLGALSSAFVPRWLTVHIDANAAAAFLEGSLPLAVALVINTYRRMRWLWIACSCTIAYGMVLTASRGAWVALLAALLLAGLALIYKRRSSLRVLRMPNRFDGKEKRLWLFVAVGLLLMLIAGVLLFVSSSGQRVFAAAEYRAVDRLTLYRNSFFLALDFPLTGIGAGATFGMTYSHFQLLIQVPYLSYAHNLFLAVWLAQGLIGLIGFGALILMAARLFWRAAHLPADPAIQRICWGAMLGSTVALLHGLTDAPQYDVAWPVLLINFLMFGIAVAAANLIDRRPLRSLAVGKRGTAIVAVALCCTLLVLWRPLIAALQSNVAAIFEAKSALAPRLTPDERDELHAAASQWNAGSLAIDPQSVAALKRSGILSIDDHDFATAIAALELAHQRSPADQSISKALGYAYIWNGNAADGVRLFRELDRVGEVRQELDAWPLAWQQRGRDDLAAQAQRAALLLTQER